MAVETRLDSGQLLKRLAATRDGAAWAELIDRHGAEVFRVTRRILPDEALAEDACQETLLQVREYAGQFSVSTVVGAGNGEDCARRWILRIAANTALMVLRKRRRGERGVIMAHTKADQEGPGAAAHRSQVLDRIHHELGALPELLRSAVVMRYFANLNYEEMAAELRCPVGTAKARVSRGIERLRGRLAAGGLVLATGALNELMAPASVANSALDASRSARWKQLLNTKRIASLHALPAKGLTLMAKLSIAGAGILLTTLVAVTQWPGRAADAVGGHPDARTASGADPVIAQGPEKTDPVRPATAATDPKTDAANGKFVNQRAPLGVIGALKPAPASEGDRAAMGARARAIVEGKPAPNRFTISIHSDGKQFTAYFIGGDKAQVLSHYGSVTVPADQIVAILRALGAELDTLPPVLGVKDATNNESNGRISISFTDSEKITDYLKSLGNRLPDRDELAKLKENPLFKGEYVEIELLKNWKNAAAFWTAVTALEDTLKKSPPRAPSTVYSGGLMPPATTAGLSESFIARLAKVASGELSDDTFVSSFTYSTGAFPAPLKLGDEAPHFSVRIAKTGDKAPVAQVQTSIVTEMRPFGQVAIPTFKTQEAELEISEAEMRQVAGLLADLGPSEGLKTARSNGSDEFRVDASVNGQTGSLSVNSSDPAEAKRIKKLLALLTDFKTRAKKK